jgi:short-subunit dehydrogenase
MSDIISDFTSVIHREPYPAISPLRAELSQAGRNVLITGGSLGVGKAMARNFMLASAAHVIITARRLDVLKTAAAELEEEAKQAKSPTKFIVKTCDMSKIEELNALWDDLKAEGIFVDVLISNAVKYSKEGEIFDIGVGEVWSQFEANVRGPLILVDRFYKQDGEKQKVSVTVSL